MCGENSWLSHLAVFLNKIVTTKVVCLTYYITLVFKYVLNMCENIKSSTNTHQLHVYYDINDLVSRFLIGAQISPYTYL